MKTRPLVLGAVALVSVGSGWLLAVTVRSSSEESLSSSTALAQDGVAEAATFSELDVARLEKGLVSGDAGQVASVLVSVEGVDLGEVAAEMLPEGTQVDIDRSTYVDFGGGFGAVEAELLGPIDASVILYLHFVGSQWLVSGTSKPSVVDSSETQVPINFAMFLGESLHLAVYRNSAGHLAFLIGDSQIQPYFGVPRNESADPDLDSRIDVDALFVDFSSPPETIGEYTLVPRLQLAGLASTLEELVLDLPEGIEASVESLSTVVIGKA